MGFLRKIDEFLEDYILAFLLLMIFLILMTQIILRTIGFSLSWAEELSRYLFAISGFLSIGYTIKKKNILKVDIITSLFPLKVRKILNIILMIITGAFFGYLGFHSIELVRRIRQFGQVSAGLGFPIWILYFCVMFSLFIVIIRSIQDIIIQVKAYNKVDLKEVL